MGNAFKGKAEHSAGVDREPKWVEEAAARAHSRSVADRFSYRLGEAERLPFADNSATGFLSEQRPDRVGVGLKGSQDVSAADFPRRLTAHEAQLARWMLEHGN